MFLVSKKNDSPVLPTQKPTEESIRTSHVPTSQSNMFSLVKITTTTTKKKILGHLFLLLFVLSFAHTQQLML